VRRRVAAPAGNHASVRPVARFFLLLAGLVVAVLLFFPDEVETALMYAKQMIEQLAVGAAGYYGAR